MVRRRTQKPADYAPKPVPMGDHQSIKFTGTDFQDKLTATLEDPQGEAVDAQVTSVKASTEVNVTADLKVTSAEWVVVRE